MVRTKTTIWGEIQSEKEFCRGISSVSTAGHGGTLVVASLAKKKIPREILKKIPCENGYYQFEEDSAAYIPAFFCPNEVIEGIVRSCYPYKEFDSKRRLHIYYTFDGIRRNFPNCFVAYPNQTKVFRRYAEFYECSNIVKELDSALGGGN